MIADTFRRLIKRATDHIIEGRNRTAIIWGTDRKKEDKSGYGDGGKNDIDSGTIDIVAGYVGENPDYLNDKSRIYLSGKTDPDDYFQFTQGENIQGEPAIVVFSDNSYVAARSVIKIITPKARIILNADGNVEIHADQIATISAQQINLETDSNSIPARILTENDICVGHDSTGAPVVCNFLDIGEGAMINKSNVKIK